MPNFYKESNLDNIGQQIYDLAVELYPICRSITGDGFRQSLSILSQHIPLQIHEVPTGASVFDWTIPKEWNIRDAYIKDLSGQKIVDFQQSNLHVLNYSIPINRRVMLDELKEHLFSIPDQPDLIPYRTSYYKENWGFCITHNQLEKLQDNEYDVLVDSSLNTGSLTYGEYYLAGESKQEILISCHCCHPSLCNDNLSGMALTTVLAKILTPLQRHYSYRFIFIPGTIGSITWLSLNKANVSNIQHGLVVACVGDPGKMTYKKSRRGNAEIDKAVLHVLEQSGQEFAVREFSPYGYDERQYCSPGFNLAVGCLSRSPHGTFPEYHTSADNLDFIHPQHLGDSIEKYIEVLDVLEHNRKYNNLFPYGEPQLGKRGLYSALGGLKENQADEMAMLWVLNLADGENTLLDIAEKSNLPFSTLQQVAEILFDHQLLEISP